MKEITNVLRSALASDAALLTGISSTTTGEDMDYLHTHILHRDCISTLTHTRLGVSGHVPAQFIHHIILIIHIICIIPSFLICFRFHVRVHTTTGTWHYYWVPPLAGTYVNSFCNASIFRLTSQYIIDDLIRQCQTAGEGDHNKELNTQAIVVSIGNHTSLSTALIETLSLQLVTLFNSAADLLAIAQQDNYPLSHAVCLPRP